MSWLRFFLILLIPLICHAWLWKKKSKSSPASSRTPRYTSSSRTPTHSWTARKPSIRRPSIRRPSRPACSTKSSCESCTSHRSWSGSCRWCPDDGGCHAAGAVFTNPCRRSENIVNKWNCYRARKTTPRPKTPKPPTTSTPKQRCKTMTTCVSCTSHKSWSGSSCRWCPKDERCHAYGAILTNPCRRSQNIVNKWNCNRAPKTTPRPTTPKPPTTSTPKQRCKTMTTCVSCTSHKSWSGSSCRWCPKDEKCHAYGAILTNPCRRSQNIVNKESCSNSSSGTLTPKTSKPSTSRKLCITKTNCTSCTSHKSWSGSSCSWCPKDGKCHAHGAIWTNPCRTFQNIVNRDSCSLKLPSRRPPRTRCITKTNCTSCTSHKSWSGRPCRWCPKDGKCHAHGAIWTNPCTQSQNIVKKESCPTLTSVELCINKTNCASCTSHKSSSGFPCRWCLKDGKCHAHDAISTNLCKGSENIVNKEGCFPPPCRIMTNCSSCTSHKSSSGFPCRWCLKDGKCHAHDAISTNLCKGSENIVNKEGCFPPPCRIMTNCSSCTSHKSSSGRSCRWCPEDNKCHAYTAIFTNPCRIRQNIVNKERCFPPPCRIMTNCSSCTSHKSSSGRSCRWCPEDNKCHAYTAIFTNPCRIRQNIVKKERCFPPPCRIMTNCSSCTSHKSSSGRPCRWCPEDNKCHAYTAIFTNPCRIRQNIVNKERCFPPPCRIMTNCSSCTSHKSSSGRPCRWCPEDNECHAYTAIFTNPCRIRQNIVNKERCFPPPCRIMTNCSSCTSHMSSSGFLCRWCPEDNKCYAHDATFTNSCSIFQNININGSCPFPSSYDRNLSYKMVVLSALAYADNVSNYIAKVVKVDTFRVVKQISNPCRSSKCPGLTTCSSFIAVSEKEKAIAIVFRGAQSRCQALYGHGPSVPLSVLSGYVLDKYNPVQTYFSDQFQKIWNDMKLDVYSQIDKHPSYELWVTGHCLGGALASLASTHIAVERKTPKNKLILYTFGQPRVGNYNYSLAHDMLVPISFRVVHYADPVVHVPNCNSKVQPGTLSRCQAGLGPYHHGKEIFYNEMFNNSSYKTCDGLPRNEDVTCSNKLFAPRIEDQLNNLELYHYKYFGFDFRRYM